MGVQAEAVRKRVWPWIAAHAGELLEEVGAVARIPAPPFGEEARAGHLARRFAAVGLETVVRDAEGNVYATRPAGAPSASKPQSGGPRRLLLAAHLDTVFPPETDCKPRREGGRLYGPGVRDNSAGVAALVSLQRALDAGGIRLPTELVLAGTVGEEGLGDLRGMRALTARWKEHVRGVLVVDGDLGGIAHVGVGSVRLAASMHGPGGHSWGDVGRPSAVHALGEAIVEVSRLPVPVQPRSTVNVGRISGGLSVNTIAAAAEMEIDLRSLSPEVLGTLESGVRDVLRRCAERAGCRCEVREIGRRPTGAIPAGHPLVALTRRAYAALGIPSRSESGSTDANEPLARGLPAICTGVSRGGGVHTLGEYLEADSIPVGLKVLSYLVALLAEDWR